MLLELGFRLGRTITKKDLMSSSKMEQRMGDYNVTDPNGRFVMKKYLRDWLVSIGVVIKEDDFVIVDDEKDDFLRLFRLRSDPVERE